MSISPWSGFRIGQEGTIPKNGLVFGFQLNGPVSIKNSYQQQYPCMRRIGRFQRNRDLRLLRKNSYRRGEGTIALGATSMAMDLMNDVSIVNDMIDQRFTTTT